MSTACLVTTLCLHLINSNGGGSFFFSKSGLISLPEQIENIEEKNKVKEKIILLSSLQTSG